MRTAILLTPLILLPVACDGLRGPNSGDATSVPQPGREYVVRNGDNLYRIAEKAYGNGFLWREIYEANPWVDPVQLQIGSHLSIPVLRNDPIDPAGPVSPQDRMANGPQEYQPYEPAVGPDGDEPDFGTGEAGAAGSRHSNPGNKRSVWNTLKTRIGKKTLFGLTLDKLTLYLLLGCIAHAVFQGFVIWITTNIAFVKDTSLKKSLQATMMTEMLGVCTVGLVAAVGLMMVYAGTKDPGAAGGSTSVLFPQVEDYLRSKNGMAAVGLGTLALYVVLSLRFIPQVFGIQRSQGFTVVLLGVILPHLLAFYFVGQRYGLLG